MILLCVKLQYNSTTICLLRFFFFFVVHSPQDAPAAEPKQNVVSCIPVPEKTQPLDHKSAQDDPADVVKPLQNPSDACLFVCLFNL